MSEKVKRWDHAVRWESMKIAASYMAIKADGKYVLASDYDTLHQQVEALRAQIERAAIACAHLEAQAAREILLAALQEDKP